MKSVPTSRGGGLRHTCSTKRAAYLFENTALSSTKAIIFIISLGMFGMFKALPLLKAGQLHRRRGETLRRIPTLSPPLTSGSPQAGEGGGKP